MNFNNKFFGRSTSLSAVLQKRNNNYDLLRLMAAIAVIVCHAYAIAPMPGWLDPGYLLFKFTYSGALALIIFFFLSGLFVSSSIQRNPSLGVFTMHRVLRVLPGLIIAVFLSAYVLGPCFTTLGLKQYFSHKETMSYFYNNLLLTDLQWNLPGVFAASKFPGAVNGSLWTLPLEVRLYLMVAVFSVWSFFRNKEISIIFLPLILIVVAFCKNQLTGIMADPHAYLYIGSFAMGGICSFFKEDIIISLKGVLLLFIICLCVWMTPLKEGLFYVFFIYTLLFLFQTKLSRHIVLPGDYSYGVYIYGFPVQQAINAIAPNHTPLLNAVLSVPCALVLGVVSWHLIEKPCLAFASHFKSTNNNKIKEISAATLYNILPKNLILVMLLVPVPFIIYKIYNL